MERIENRVFDEERALYESSGVQVINCRFEGPADGESAMKESRDLEVKDCFFDLRYPFWHDQRLCIENAQMTENCRAALWYSEQISILNSRLHGVKALRECADVTIEGCDVHSVEFGWFCNGVKVKDSVCEGEYFMLRSNHLNFKNVSFKGKYSFQYIENATFENCNFDTKDAFWHAKNVVVKNCTVKGEYLAWYSENVTFDHCVIIGTQPLCYCKGLALIDCEMHEADLAFERSDVRAEITTPVISIKNPTSGSIRAPKVGELIDVAADCACQLRIGDVQK
jgi:hypothetical protein